MDAIVQYYMQKGILYSDMLIILPNMGRYDRLNLDIYSVGGK